MTKDQLRQSILNRRKQIELYPLSAYIALRLWGLIHRLQISNLLVYSPLQGEVDLVPLYEAHWKNHGKIYFPKITGARTMDFFQTTSQDDLIKHSTLRVLEPLAHESKRYSGQNISRTAILVPSLGLDKSGNRLGFGRAFYDTYISRYPQLIKIALQFEEFIFEKLPADSWDQKMSWMITEKQTSEILL